MLTLATLEEELKAIGCNFRFWGRSELKELCHVLLDDEKIAHCINGQYEVGFALLCATDRRVLLVDKKPRFLTLKDIRYEMITEMDYNHRLMNATVRLFTPNKELHFTAYNQARLRKMFHFVQQKVVENRQHFMLQQFQAQALGMPANMPLLQASIQQPQPPQPEPTFVPNNSSSQSRLTSLMGKMGVKGSQSHDATIDATYVRPTAFRGWRRRPLPYRF